MKKSLAPLIIFLSLIVLLTAIVVNTRPEMRPSNKKTESEDKEKKSIYLSNIDTPKQYIPSGSKENHEMNREKLLNILFKAYSDLDNGKISEAEGDVKTVLVFQPRNKEALALLGKIFYLKHEYTNAEMIFRKQIRLDKKSASAYNNLGQILLKQKKYTPAAEQFRKAQEINPESGLVALNLASVYSQLGKKEESLNSFKKAFDILGTRIISAADHPALDNIRNENEFKSIMKKAKDLALEKKQKQQVSNNPQITQNKQKSEDIK